MPAAVHGEAAPGRYLVITNPIVARCEAKFDLQSDAYVKQEYNDSIAVLKHSAVPPTQQVRRRSKMRVMITSSVAS